MPNHYGNTLICQTGNGWYDDNYEEPHEAAVKDAVEVVGLPQVAVPMSAEAKASAEGMEPGAWPAWLVWARAQWGTRWGGYNGKFVRMAADGAPPLITFNTAWGPPHAECRQAVREWLAARGVIVHLWVGSEPGDDTTEVLEDWTAKRG